MQSSARGGEKPLRNSGGAKAIIYNLPRLSWASFLSRPGLCVGSLPAHPPKQLILTDRVGPLQR